MKNPNRMYLDAICCRVCKVCTERTAEGDCGLPAGVVCPIKQHLPRIVDVVHSVPGGMIKRYVPHLREHVCKRCPNLMPDGSCPVRKNIDCPLDRYFSLVVDAIEKADASLPLPRMPRAYRDM